MKNFILKNKSNLKKLSLFYTVVFALSFIYYNVYELFTAYLNSLEIFDPMLTPVLFVCVTGCVITFSVVKLLLPNTEMSMSKDLPKLLGYIGIISAICLVGFFSFVPFFALGKLLYFLELKEVGYFLLFLVFPPVLIIHLYAYLYLMYCNNKDKLRLGLKEFLGKLFFDFENKKVN